MNNINNIKDRLYYLLNEIVECDYFKNQINIFIFDYIELDSIQLISFIILIEKEFDIEINFENFNIKNFKNPDTLANFILNQINEQYEKLILKKINTGKLNDKK